MSAKVSVIIPTYNRATLLQESVESALSQDYENIEVIVVDDGSTDETENIARSFGSRIVYLKQKNSGPSAARNLGILYSSGDYLMFLDSDDVLLPGCIKKLATTLDRNPDFGAAYCGWLETDGPAHISRKSPLNRPSGDVFVEMATQYFCIVHSIMVRRNCLATSGIFDTSLQMYEDMDFNVRIAAYHRLIFVPEHLVEYRLWQSDLSRRRSNLRKQQDMYIEKMSYWRSIGKLDSKGWQALKEHIYGTPQSKKLIGEAYKAYDTGQWTQALMYSLRALFRDPRYILRRGWCALVAKSAMRWTGCLLNKDKNRNAQNLEVSDEQL